MATKIKHQEGWLNASVFGAAFLLALFSHSTVWKFVHEHDINYQGIYSAVFDLNSVFIAFMFSYFAFLKTADNEFLRRAKKTNTYGILERRIVATMRTSLLFAAVCLIVIAVAPVVWNLWEYHNFLVAVWFGLLILLLVQFVRLNEIFWIFISVE